MKGLVGILLAAGSAAAFFGVASAQPIGVGPRAVLFDQPNFQGRSVTIVEGSPNLASWDFAARAMSARFEGDWTVCDSPDMDGRCATVRGDVADLSQTGLRRIVSLGEGAAEEASYDGERKAAGVAMTDAGASADAQTAPGPDDMQVPGPRAGGRGDAYDGPPPPPAPPQAAPSKPAPTFAAEVAAAPPAPAAPKGPAPQQLASAAPPPVAPASSAAIVEAPKPAGVPAAQGDAGRSAVFFAKPMRAGAEVSVDVQGPANQFCREQGLGPAAYYDTDGKVLRDVLCRRS